ncbi:MAG: hypothetical protein BGP24_11445 [Lysobacterales bacterium 69-70]|nr:MAG: hypothetical protein ABS97_21215 [Xanthomonadaceae bacterium SCN 69-320]ODV22159.1 MAG: hypothetical protein ABT27_02590 [Xanthomonadaceae bacterium SCN 69-25]OJY98420.1 MAG: hypothetical protein BGP24_11445 [Xanthomonadales bacterium 69-70]
MGFGHDAPLREYFVVCLLLTNLVSDFDTCAYKLRLLPSSRRIGPEFRPNVFIRSRYVSEAFAGSYLPEILKLECHSISVAECRLARRFSVMRKGAEDFR